MAKEDTNKDMLLMRAKRLQRYCDLLIQQCDNWLAVPERKKTNNNKSFGCFKSLSDWFFLKKNKLNKTLDKTK